ncbi:MAG: NfeD family protein [Pirellulaceae bacterium]|nr:NfeD family protein [Pirellulaceae bacterium]
MFESIPRFEFTSDAAYIFAAYLSVLIATSLWIYFSKQRLVQRSYGTIVRISIRLAIVFALVLSICWYAKLATWVFGATIVAIVMLGFLIDLPVSGFVSFAILYVIQQFVLGFPARHEWVMGPDGPTAAGSNIVDKRTELVGRTATTFSPLRPIGEVCVGEQKHSAIANNGQLINEGKEVVIIAVRNGKLIVRQVDD